MPKVTLYNTAGAAAGEIELNDSVFGVEYNEAVIHQAVVRQMANERLGTHATKTRGLVRGGGKKPWKQKGTGRARAGSNRSPIWRGGAVIFGPSPRDYSFKVNSKVRALAMKMALSSRLAAETLMVVKGIELPEAKTKHFAKVADTLGLSKALIVAPAEDSALTRSARNIPGLTMTTVDRLSVLEILKHKQLVLLEGAVESVQARFAKKGA